MLEIVIELLKVLKRWIHEKSKSTTVEDVTQSSKVQVVSIRNKPSIKPTAIVFFSSEKIKFVLPKY